MTCVHCVGEDRRESPSDHTSSRHLYPPPNLHLCVCAAEWDEFKGLDFKKIYSTMIKPAFVFDGECVGSQLLVLLEAALPVCNRGHSLPLSVIICTAVCLCVYAVN